MNLTAPRGLQVRAELRRRTFPFIGAHDPAIGYHETCALFSPMNGFTSQGLARETALASLALVRPQPEPDAVPPVAAEPLPPRRGFFMARRPDAGAAHDMTPSERLSALAGQPARGGAPLAQALQSSRQIWPRWPRPAGERSCRA
jgi:hypothetical protein